MAFPLAVGAGIAAAGWAADVLGGRAARRAANDQFNANLDTSIQRRVADARKAGISPLAALGATTGASPTITVSGGRTRHGAHAANVNRALEQFGTNDAKSASLRESEARIEYLNAQTKDVELDGWVKYNKARREGLGLDGRGNDHEALTGLNEAENLLTPYFAGGDRSDPSNWFVLLSADNPTEAIENLTSKGVAAAATLRYRAQMRKGPGYRRYKRGANAQQQRANRQRYQRGQTHK